MKKYQKKTIGALSILSAIGVALYYLISVPGLAVFLKPFGVVLLIIFLIGFGSILLEEKRK